MVVSITFVLFLVGLLGILLINSKKVADHFKEQIALTLFIKDDARPIDVTQLQKSLQLEKATRQVIFVSKEEAAAQHAQEIGEDFMEYLGYNPLLASIDVYEDDEHGHPVKVSGNHSLKPPAELRAALEASGIHILQHVVVLTQAVRAGGLDLAVAGRLC